MRGQDDRSEGFFSYVRLEERIPGDHPLRPIRALADEALGALNRRGLEWASIRRGQADAANGQDGVFL
jgi:hypothetical protein